MYESTRIKGKCTWRYSAELERVCFFFKEKDNLLSFNKNNKCITLKQADNNLMIEWYGLSTLRKVNELYRSQLEYLGSAFLFTVIQILIRCK